jgi:hypothetical protein
MFNLLIKDLLIQKKSLWYLLFYILILLLVFTSTSMDGDIAVVLYATCTCFIGYLLIAGACSYDEQNRSEVFLNSLPITRKDIVLSKYLSIFVYAVIGGHGINSIGEIAIYAKNGYDGVIQLAPFSCIPEIMAKGIVPRVSREEGIPVMTIFIDEQTAAAGVITRLEAFLDLLERRREEKAVKKQLA